MGDCYDNGTSPCCGKRGLLWSPVLSGVVVSGISSSRKMVSNDLPLASIADAVDSITSRLFRQPRLCWSKLRCTIPAPPPPPSYGNKARCFADPGPVTTPSDDAHRTKTEKTHQIMMPDLFVHRLLDDSGHPCHEPAALSHITPGLVCLSGCPLLMGEGPACPCFYSRMNVEADR